MSEEKGGTGEFQCAMPAGRCKPYPPNKSVKVRLCTSQRTKNKKEFGERKFMDMGMVKLPKQNHIQEEGKANSLLGRYNSFRTI